VLLYKINSNGFESLLIEKFQFVVQPLLIEVFRNLNIKSLHDLQSVNQASLGACVEHIESWINVPWAVENKYQRVGTSSVGVFVLIAVKDVSGGRIRQIVCNIFNGGIFQGSVYLNHQLFFVNLQNESVAGLFAELEFLAFVDNLWGNLACFGSR